MNSENFDYCIIDADSIIYQFAHTEPSPALCAKKFDDRIEEIIKNTEALNSYVFIKGESNFRHEWSSYKANRKDNIDPAVKDRIIRLYKHANSYCIESDGAEADDYVRIAATGCLKNDMSCVVAHIDKDLNCIPGWHYNFRTGESVHITYEEAYRFQMMQVLQGDSTDNIKGIKGMGPKTAEKLLKDVPPINILDTVFSIWESKVGKDWKEPFVECANLIYMRESADDLRALSFEELEERFTWNETMATGSPYRNDPQTPSDSCTELLDQQEGNTLERNS